MRKVLKRMSGPNRQEITRGWREFNNVEVRGFFFQLVVFFQIYMPCGTCVFQRFGGLYCPHLQGDSMNHVDTEVVGKRPDFLQPSHMTDTLLFPVTSAFSAIQTATMKMEAGFPRNHRSTRLTHGV